MRIKKSIKAGCCLTSAIFHPPFPKINGNWLIPEEPEGQNQQDEDEEQHKGGLLLDFCHLLLPPSIPLNPTA